MKATPCVVYSDFNASLITSLILSHCIFNGFASGTCNARSIIFWRILRKWSQLWGNWAVEKARGARPRLISKSSRSVLKLLNSFWNSFSSSLARFVDVDRYNPTSVDIFICNKKDFFPFVPPPQWVHISHTCRTLIQIYNPIARVL